MASESALSEIIERERKKLVEILQQDPDSILDTLTSRGLVSDEEYESLENIQDPLKKSRKLLILVQKKGEVSCQHFLKCLFNAFPESTSIQDLRHEFLKHENIEPPLQSMGVGKYSEDCFYPAGKQSENPEITVTLKDKYVDSGNFKDNKSIYRETALSERVNEKDYNSPQITVPYLAENVEYEVPATIEYLQDGQRYEQPDDSLYLGKEDYLGTTEYSEDADTTVDEENNDNLENIVYDGEEDSAYSETTEYSDEHCEESEHSISLEEEEKRIEERKEVFKEVLSCLNIDRSRKLLPDVIKQYSLDRGEKWIPKTPGDLVWNFLMKVQALDVKARDSVLTLRALDEDSKGDLLTAEENLEIRGIQAINPLDVLCAAMLCADGSLQREVMSNMYQCQFALPLLLPDAENNKVILMQGAMRGIVKESAQASGGPPEDTEKLLAHTKMPVISFVRLGYCSFSKSKILNRLLSSAGQKSHEIFLHSDLPAQVLPRQISDGLVEITWCFPDSDHLKANPSFFQKPVALTNLHGDLESFWTQFGFLMEISSAVFFFTDCLGQKEWDLLMFLSEEAIDRCYFVLSAQARESEEAEIFQRILKLKAAQLLFWEEEGAEETGKNMEFLQAALQEVMSSSLTCVSLEDMASLAWELGVQVDQDFEKKEEIPIVLSEGVAAIDEDEKEQRHDESQSPSESSVEMPAKEPCGQNVHIIQVFMPQLAISNPAPPIPGGNLNCVSWRAPRAMGSPFWSGQRSKWFRPLPFQNPRAPSQGKCFGRFYSGKSFIKFPQPDQGCHQTGTFERPQRHVSQHTQAWLKRPPTMGALQWSEAAVPQVRHSHFQGSQPAGATGKHTRTPYHIKPHPPAFSPAQSKFGPRFEFKSNQPKPPQVTHPQHKPSQPQPTQTKPTQSQLSRTKYFPLKPAQPKSCQPPSSQPKPPQPLSFQCKPRQPPSSQPKPPQPPSSPSKPSQTQSSQSKPCQHHPTHAKPSSSKCTQHHPCGSQSSQPKLSQHRPTQPKSSKTSPSQAKAYYRKAGPTRVGKR
ncbi:PREDICTED: caspase recruitment domain-containing protein 6 [Condylura cristata]|uniref:caspase recruitment domain-containing protein 6 n=1 Tax=Condylura cristata TaxID=143302 RepID=UPI00033465E8|nr:PREDICTED: caspase recruitment domain-containing protein 6 [Condylura cristata]